MNKTLLILICLCFVAVILIQDNQVGKLKRDIIILQEAVIILNEENRGRFDAVSDSQVFLLNKLDSTFTVVRDALEISDEKIEFLRRENISIDRRIDSIRQEWYWDDYPTMELLEPDFYREN